MTLYRKAVHLKNIDIHKDLSKIPLVEGLEVSHHQIDNNETFSCFIHIDKQELNNKLNELSKNILSDRCRTLKNIPKYRIINTKKERIQ